jgi:hypothetical protein
MKHDFRAVHTYDILHTCMHSDTVRINPNFVGGRCTVSHETKIMFHFQLQQYRFIAGDRISKNKVLLQSRRPV